MLLQSFDIFSSFVQTFCRTITRAFGLDYNYWIGLSDQVNEGNFSWVNGYYANLNDYSLWYPGHPNTYDNNALDCCWAYFSGRDIYTYVFLAFDIHCSSSHQSICEKRA